MVEESWTSVVCARSGRLGKTASHTVRSVFRLMEEGRKSLLLVSETLFEVIFLLCGASKYNFREVFPSRCRLVFVLTKSTLLQKVFTIDSSEMLIRRQQLI